MCATADASGNFSYCRTRSQRLHVMDIVIIYFCSGSYTYKIALWLIPHNKLASTIGSTRGSYNNHPWETIYGSGVMMIQKAVNPAHSVFSFVGQSWLDTLTTPAYCSLTLPKHSYHFDLYIINIHWQSRMVFFVLYILWTWILFLWSGRKPLSGCDTIQQT